MYFSDRILLSIAFLAVLPIFVGVCLVNCQRISQKFRFLFVIMVTFGMVILSIDVMGQFKYKVLDYQQIGLINDTALGLMILSKLSLIVYCLFMLMFFFVVITQNDSSDSSSKYCSVLLSWLCYMFLLFAIILSIGLLFVAPPIACSVTILLVFILIVCLIEKKSQTGRIKKWDFSTEETQMSQQAQYEGAMSQVEHREELSMSQVNHREELSTYVTS